ncbi:(2Fe-2S)-binding protein [Roseateles sp. So40a]|uniref:(2Fe-2S)-binding protein n=1 Tax=Roseateles sp. So40a TaxID=3400226 RepID=UPI003A83DEC8
MPSLQGRCGVDGSGRAERGLPAGLAAEELVAAMRASEPAAGRAFWALRAWARLVWQPTYASVFAVELAGRVLSLDGLRWEVDVDEADVSGFIVTARGLNGIGPRVLHQPSPQPLSRFAGEGLAGTRHEERRRAAAQVLAMSSALLTAVQAQLPLHPKAARRLLADCVLSALLRAQPITRLADEQVRDLGADWLALLDATGDSDYLAFHTAAGDSRLALDRGVCCLDDRRAGGELCNTCPRLPRAERLRRLGAQDLRNSA